MKGGGEGICLPDPKVQVSSMYHGAAQWEGYGNWEETETRNPR